MSIKTASERYVKLTPIEHVLLRPDTYIGSIQTENRQMFVATDYDKLNDIKIEYKPINYNPGFIKIFDEVIVNASDQSIRTSGVSYIKIIIDDQFISVENDGPGIPVVMHDEHKIYIPELIFANLLSGENLDDSEERFVGGRNGIGVKCTNIFSKKFIIETADGNKVYYQECSDNLSKINKPKIRKSTKNFVKVTYYPDYEKFGLSGMTEDLKSVLIKRVLDISAYNPTLKVFLNNRKISINTFRDYMKLYINNNGDNLYYDKINDNWEIGVMKSPVDEFKQVSMVNGISTNIGGTHVNLVSNQIVNNIKENLTKSNKGLNIKPNDIKNRLLIFVNCKISNPVFDNQTKENLTSKINIRDFNINDNLIKRLSKDEMLSDLIELSLLKEKIELGKELNKTTSKRIRIDKLLDANKAGTSESDKCSIFLTEGDSAKSFVVTGFSQIGRDYYGAFPLKGKPLNVRDVSTAKIKENDEIKNIIQILGLEFGKKYKNTKGLRYGKVIITADSDNDGYHIKGLLINLFHIFWPELIKMDFLYEFITPILKVTKSNKDKFFYKLSDYEKWLSENGQVGGYSVKYYKGLGTSEPYNIKMFFKNIDKHLIKFNYSEPEKTEDIIDLAFRKKREDDRKNWLLDYKPNSLIDKFTHKTTYLSFMNNEFIEFSMADNIRSIPCIMDGLKPSQRKILYTLFKTDNNGELNVGELFGMVKSKSNYHHGPQALEQGIIGMAQDFIGSNNISLLEPIGGFGTRLSGGADCSAPRYINTRLRNITKNIFIQVDNNIIGHKNEDGKLVEPNYYIPIIPVILLNGTEGIGTGWSTFIPKFNINDLVLYLENKLNNKRKNIEFHPYYNGFKGDITKDNNEYISRGVINRINSTTLNITELPIGVWNDNYYHLLDKLIDDKIIKTYYKNCTDTDVNITVKIQKEILDEFTDDDLINIFKLTSKIRTGNMHLFDKWGKIKKYEDQYQIIDEFYDNRLSYYDMRKNFLINKLTEKKLYISNLIKFINLIVDKKITINNKPISEIVKSLEGYNISKIDDSFDYLLNISLVKLTKDNLDKLNNERVMILSDLEKTINTPIEKMWIDDLNELKKQIKKL